MKSAHIIISIFSILTPANALQAFIHYENAACVDQNTISGTYIMDYDEGNENFSGMTWENYSGECMYFTGGSLNLWLYDLSSYSSMISYGYCVECDDGQVGCSSDGTCDNLMSNPAQQKYQASAEGQSQTKQSYEDVYPGFMAYMKEAVMQSQQMQDRTYASYYLVGGGMVAVVGLSLFTVQALSKRVREAERRERFLPRDPNSRTQENIPESGVL